MPTPKSPKPTADDALISALTEPAVPLADIEKTAAALAKVAPAAPTPAPAPSAPTPVEEVEYAILQEATPSELIKALIEAFDGDVDDVSSIEIRRPGLIRIAGKDRGLRSRRFDWPKNEVAE